MYSAIVQAFLIDGAYMVGALVVALPTLVLFLNWLDKRNAKGKSAFSEHFKAMEADPTDLAIYLGFRFVGACLCVGLVAGALILR